MMYQKKKKFKQEIFSKKYIFFNDNCNNNKYYKMITIL